MEPTVPVLNTMNNTNNTDIIALFVDFENIRYSALNSLERDVDPQLLMAKARKYGRVNVANAYADFSRQPEFYKRSLEAAGIARVDVPIKVSNNREQSAVDLYMVMDIFDTVLDRPQISTFLLMTGDRDFVRICAKLKHQFDKKVIVSGIHGSVSNDLIASATHFDPLDLPATETNRRRVRERQVIRYLSEIEPQSKLPPSYTWLRVKLLEPSSRLNMGMEEADTILSDFVKRNVLARKIIAMNGRDYRTTYLNRNHPAVIDAAGPSRAETARFHPAAAPVAGLSAAPSIVQAPEAIPDSDGLADQMIISVPGPDGLSETGTNIIPNDTSAAESNSDWDGAENASINSLNYITQQDDLSDEYPGEEQTQAPEPYK